MYVFSEKIYIIHDYITIFSTFDCNITVEDSQGKLCVHISVTNFTYYIGNTTIFLPFAENITFEFSQAKLCIYILVKKIT